MLEDHIKFRVEMMTFDENGVSPWVQGKRKNSVTPLEIGRDLQLAKKRYTRL